VLLSRELEDAPIIGSLMPFVAKSLRANCPYYYSFHWPPS